MSKSIDEARAEVKGLMARAQAYADDGEPRSVAIAEAELWTMLLGIGRALMMLFLVRQAARKRSAEYVHDGRRYRIDGGRTSELGTRFGKLSWWRPVGRLVGWQRRSVDLPIDRELGLGGGFSLGVIVAMGRRTAQMALAGAQDLFRETYEWAPSPRATLRMVDSLGERARPFLNGAVVPEDDGDVLVIEVDGGGAPMISEAEYERRAQPRESSSSPVKRHERRARRRRNPQPRRTSGKKSKNSKVAVVAVIYTLRTTDQGMEGPIGKRIYATFDSHDALFQWIEPLARQRGYGKKRTLFLADGSEHIWRCQQKYFPAAEACLDWYHAIEKIWGASTCLFKAGATEQKTWVDQMADHLRHGRPQMVITELRRRQLGTPKTGPGNKWRREQLDKSAKYLDDHLARLRYAEFREHDWDIGSGAVEGAVRNLVRMRFDGPGMRWGRIRSERLLHLRCILLNGQWREFANHLASGPPVRLAAQPIPAEPYNAKAAA